MVSKRKTVISEEKVALYDKLIATNPEIERKGANNPYTALNGNMFTLLNPPNGQLAIRLPEVERAKFIDKYDSAIFVAHGRLMTEYVAVPDSLLRKTSELAKYLNLSYEYAKTLKPKPSKK